MSIIDENTEISELIDKNINTIEALSQINSSFLKLKNPVLRNFFIKGVTIRQAASIGGVTSKILLKELEKIGFEVDYLSK